MRAELALGCTGERARTYVGSGARVATWAVGVPLATWAGVIAAFLLLRSVLTGALADGAAR